MGEEHLAWCNQPLGEHLDDVARIVALEDDALGKLEVAAEEVGCRLRKDALRREVLSSAAKLAQALDVGLGEAHKLLAVAAYLHDVGKAASEYQDRLRRAAKQDPERCPTQLRGHEILSAWLAWHLVYELLGGGDKAAAIAAGVALHHSARRSIDDVLDDVRSAGLTREDVRTLVATARGVERFWDNADWGDVWRSVGGRLAWEYLQTLDAAVLRLRNRLLAPAAVWGELVAYVVMLADNLDAALYRGGERLVYVVKPLLECGG
jgi:CRISPR-associated endonuclease Cas3-HD